MRNVYVDHERRVIVVRYSGLVDNSDAQIGVPEFRQMDGWSFLIDLRQVGQFDVSTESIQVAAARSGPGPGVRCAFVAETQIAYGLTRMFELYSGSDRFGVFRTVAAACDWLRIPTAVADTALEELAQRVRGGDN
jgi:hypothetical protein